MKKILVTGGSGFIGSHLVDRLSEQYKTIVFDTKIPYNSNINFIKGDITDFEDLKEIKNLEGIIHLAAISGVSNAEKNPQKTININILGTLNILELAKKLNAWVILGNTIEPPVNLYGLSKHFCELLGQKYSRDSSLKILNLKFSTTYGSLRDNPNKVIPKLIKQALNNETLLIKNARSYFDFIFVKDLTKGIHLATKYIEGKNQIFYDSIPLCTGKPTTLKNLAEIIINKTNSNSKLIIEKQEQTQRDLQNPKKTQVILGFKPKIDIQEGIKKTIQEIKNYINI